jgi:hypothetical protein
MSSDIICKANDIEHGLTRPNQPKAEDLHLVIGGLFSAPHLLPPIHVNGLGSGEPQPCPPALLTFPTIIGFQESCSLPKTCVARRLCKVSDQTVLLKAYRHPCVGQRRPHLKPRCDCHNGSASTCNLSPYASVARRREMTNAAQQSRFGPWPNIERLLANRYRTIEIDVIGNCKTRVRCLDCRDVDDVADERETFAWACQGIEWTARSVSRMYRPSYTRKDH